MAFVEATRPPFRDERPLYGGGAVVQPAARPSLRSEAKRTVSSIGWSAQSVWTEPFTVGAAEDIHDHFGSRFVMTERNPVRLLWSVLILLLLVYTGTFFVYRTCFYDFAIQYDALGKSNAEDTAASPSWRALDEVVFYIFVVDLFANFFFSYHDEALGQEVYSLRLIAKSYLRGSFFVNLLGCIPGQMLAVLLSSQSTVVGTNATMAARLSRLIRLIRLARVADMGMKSKIPMLRWLREMKGGRILGLILRLAWIVHIFACGWYLCAALAEKPENTWIFRRKVDGQGAVPLLARPPLDQWMNCMYFVLTVFTTVGFGDINACTIGEIAFVFCTMVIGAIIHSVIVSEVISLITANDQVKELMTRQTRLVEAFSEHADINEGSLKDLKSWVRVSATYRSRTRSDLAEVKQLITGADMPQPLLAQLPNSLHGGRLIKNTIFGSPEQQPKMPPRLPVLVALASQRVVCQAGEILYKVSDYPFNLFIVIAGTFAYVAEPAVGRKMGIMSPNSTGGGRTPERRRTSRGTLAVLKGKLLLDSEVTHDLAPFQLFSMKTYFGDTEVFHNQPRQTTARCETEGGVVLQLHTNEVKSICEEFPEFKKQWRHAAWGHALTLKRLQARVVIDQSYLDFAATTIQTYWTSWHSGALKTSCKLTKNLSLEIMQAAMEVERSMPDSGPRLSKKGTIEEDPEKDLASQVQELSARVDQLQEALVAHVGQLSARMDSAVAEILQAVHASGPQKWV